MPVASIDLDSVETTILVTLLVGYALWFVVRRLSATRPDLRIGAPIAVAYGLRLVAIAAVGVAGLTSTLRGGDETTFLHIAHHLAEQPLGRGDWPHGPYQLHVVVFALEMKLLHLSPTGIRIIQVALALLGMILMLAAAYDLVGRTAPRVAAWVYAFEPASMFFNSAIHKEPLMELASGLVVFGGTMVWRRLDVRGMLVCALGGLIAVETRSYAGWFLVAATVLILLHAALRNINRPLRAMPVIFGIIVAVVLVTPVLLQLSSSKSLQHLQISQNANATGAGEGSGHANSDNLALEQVDFSTRGAILRNLPQRISDVVLRPYPWQLGDNAQRFGAVGTLFVYVVLFLLFRYAWLCRGEVFARAGPLLYPLFFLTIAYALSVGNAGTGFRYRTHLTTLAIVAMAVLADAARQRIGQAVLAGEPPRAAEPARPATAVAPWL